MYFINRPLRIPTDKSPKHEVAIKIHYVHRETSDHRQKSVKEKNHGMRSTQTANIRIIRCKI